MSAGNFHELQPAYGRDYKSQAEVEAAFREGKDFLGDASMGFQLCSIADFAKGTKQNLRYKKLTRVHVVTV